MRDPSYRLYTYCPEGMSASLRDYLAQPVNDEMTTSDIIAINLLQPFSDSRLPFACTFVGWAAGPMESQLEGLLTKLNDLTVATNRQKISIERLGLDIEGGLMQIAGAYPLNDLKRDMVETEYESVSFVLNRQISEDMMIWLQDTLVDGLPETDKIGVFCAILGDSEDLLDNKMQEIMTLLQMNEMKIPEEWADPETRADELHTILLFYSAPHNGLQSYSLFFGSASSVYDSASELLQDVWRRNRNLQKPNLASVQFENNKTPGLDELEGFSVGEDLPGGEIARVVFSGQGQEGVVRLIDYLLHEIEIIDSERLWYEKPFARAQLIDFKTRVEKEMNQQFMDELRGFIGLILE